MVIRPLTDSRGPFSRAPMLHVDATMSSAVIGVLRISSTFRNFEISGFKEAKCDAPGFKELKKRNLRTCDILHLPDSRDPLLSMSYFTC